MTIADATREYQAALEYRRTARDRYTTDDELAECDQAVEQAYAEAEWALVAHEASR